MLWTNRESHGIRRRSGLALLPLAGFPSILSASVDQMMWQDNDWCRSISAWPVVIYHPLLVWFWTVSRVSVTTAAHAQPFRKGHGEGLQRLGRRAVDEGTKGVLRPQSYIIEVVHSFGAGKRRNHQFYLSRITTKTQTKWMECTKILHIVPQRSGYLRSIDWQEFLCDFKYHRNSISVYMHVLSLL